MSLVPGCNNFMCPLPCPLSCPLPCPLCPNRDSDDKLTGGSDRFAQLYGDQHVFQEYTYKKITPCDVCREILRGHARQGLKCKMCKINVHYGECQERAPKCQVSGYIFFHSMDTA